VSAQLCHVGGAASVVDPPVLTQTTAVELWKSRRSWVTFATSATSNAGCLIGLVSGEHADIVCCDCLAVIGSVPADDLQRTFDEMELTLG